MRPTLWNDPTQARSAVEPLLPDSLAGGDAEGEGERAASALGFREVFLEGEGLDAAVSRRLGKGQEGGGLPDDEHQPCWCCCCMAPASNRQQQQLPLASLKYFLEPWMRCQPRWRICCYPG